MQDINDRLDEAFSKMDRELGKQVHRARSAPTSNEIGWVGSDKQFRGSKSEVRIKFDPASVSGKFIYHTHPTDNPSPLTAMPSTQDLETAIEVAQKGISGLTIFSGEYYTIIVPKKDRAGNLKKYEEALKSGNHEEAVGQLEHAGFDIETGQA